MTSYKQLGSRWWAALVLVAVGGAGAAPTELTGPVAAWSDGGVSVIPLQPLADWIGATLSFDQAQRTFTGSLETGDGRTTCQVTVGQSSARVDGHAVKLARPAELARGQLIVPARFAHDAFGVAIGWDAAQRRVTFTYLDREAFMTVMPAVYPVVWHSILLGGRADGTWVNPEEMAKQLPGGETYQLYGLTGREAAAVGAKPRPEEPGEFQYVELAGATDEQLSLVALGAPWEAQVRPVHETDTTNPTYVKQVRGLLDRAGLKQAKVNLTRVLRVDLDGDGTEEVLVSAQTPREGYPRPDIVVGDYSLVLLRQVKGNRVVTTVLQAEYYTKAVGFGASYAYDVLGALDLNHDGKLEILVQWSYYEGDGVLVYELQQGRPVEVLDAGAGA